jgi:transglutaminase-like putative cysteine protease
MFTTPDSIADRKLSYIKRCISDTVNSPEFVMYLRNIFKNVRHGDVVQFLWKYNSNIRFVTENDGGDYCKDGIEFLKSKYGDCEDFTIFNMSVFRLYGIKSRIKVTDTFGQGYFTHILPQYYDYRIMRWMSFDGTYRIKGIGGEPLHYKEKFYYV